MNSNSIYKKRRTRLIKALPEGSALIVPSEQISIRSGDVEWPYRPSSNLIYLSGFKEAQSCLIILSKPKAKHFLFVQKKDLKKELWTGPIYGPKQAQKIFQMDVCYPSCEFFKIAPTILKNIYSLYYHFGINPHWDIQVKKLIQTLKRKRKSAVSLQDPVRLIAPFRMTKSREEIQMITKAVEISSEAHIEVMKHTRAGMNERELHGIFLSEIMKKGADGEAYTGIFASGPKACTLHYTNNNRVMKKGELLLVDAGAEYHYYASDITRTFPVSGKFSKIQKQIYTKLLKAQKTIIQILKPGLFFNDIQNKLIELLSVLMKEEKLLSGSVKEIIKKKQYRKYFPHSFGHLLGLDVHDLAFSETKSIRIKEGFVLTIEPGIYLPKENTSLKPELRGLGFRIEDDILITKTGAKVLSQGVPKEVEELEELISKGK